MIKGTRTLLGPEARKMNWFTQRFRNTVNAAGYQEFIPSVMADPQIFVDKAGPEILGQMYVFKDKGERDVCLIPEVTAIAQKLYKEDWSKAMPKPVKIWYLTRCYRYERPQLGRYREFWQFGVENMGGNTSKEEMIDLLRKCLDECKLEYIINDSVKRGLSYYIEEGFEAEIANLGAQKQVAGGGRYDCGIGWAIGVDRVVLSKESWKPEM